MIWQWLVVAIVTCSVHTQLIQSLQNVIDYGFSQNISDMNFLIGVAIAKGQIHITEKYIKDDDIRKSVLENLANKCGILLKEAKTSEDPLSGVLFSYLWTQDYPLQPSPNPSYSLLSFIPPSSLTPTLSDKCLRSIFTGCLLPPECVLPEISDSAHGYSLTHQVLYWTIFNEMCHSITVGAVVRHKCGRVIEEHLDISPQGQPRLVDLYFEQVVVCGLHGFLPSSSFTDQQVLLSLQTSIGCFSLHKTGGQRPCDIHLSGVAAGALSLMIKYNIKEKL